MPDTTRSLASLPRAAKIGAAIVVIIIVGETKLVLHGVGIIAQTVYLGTVFLFCE